MSITQTFKDAIDLANALANPEQKLELQKLMGLLFDAQKDAFALQEENRELKERIRELEEKIKLRDRFDKEMEYYGRVEVNGKTVYRHKENGSYACPHCIEESRKIRSLHGGSHFYNCTVCKNSYQLTPVEPAGGAGKRY